MPHTKSAAKRLRQSLKRRNRNRTVIKDVKTQLKKVKSLAKTPNLDLSQFDTAVRVAVKKIDRAAARRVVHRNLASRKKSQLARLLHAKKKAAGAV